MEYKGKLYGKIGGKYFDTSYTSDDWDAMVAQINDLELKIASLLGKIEHSIDVENDFIQFSKRNYKAKDGTIKQALDINGKYFALKKDVF